MYHISELVVPGDRIMNLDCETERHIDALLSQIISCFYEANAALNLFNEELVKDHSFFHMQTFESDEEEEDDGPNFDKWKEKCAKRNEIKEQIIEEFKLDPNDYLEIAFQVDRKIKKDGWSAGRRPGGIERAKIFIYAKSFLYAFDTIHMALVNLSELTGKPEALENARAWIKEAFPGLRDIRNSAHHIEDRVIYIANRVKGRKPERLKPKPGYSGLLDTTNAEEGSLILDNLNGSRYGTTTAKGYFREIDITTHSLEKMNEIVQSIINSFEWQGYKDHYPKY